VPPLDDALKPITEPDPELLYENKSVIDQFRRCFELKETVKVEFWSILISLKENHIERLCRQ